MNRKRAVRRIIPLTLLCLALGPPLAAEGYSFEKIRVPGSLETEAHAINARGDIVGRYVDRDGGQHGFLLRKGVFTTIDFPGAASTGARGINARGDIAGTFVDSVEFRSHGYLLSDGQFTQFDHPRGEIVVDRINNAGDIVGVYFFQDGEASFIRKDGRFYEVRTPANVGFHVRAAQDNGRVLVGSGVLETDEGPRSVGWIRRRPGHFEVIDYDPGRMDLCQGVRHINQAGDIVGSFAVLNPGDECYPPFVEQHGFLLRDGQFTLIDFSGAPVTDAFAINDDGVIVGRYTTGSGRIRGFKAVPID